MKIIEKSNFRVEVFAKDYNWRNLTPEEETKACDDIVQQIERHVDNVGSVSTVWDTKELCEFCRYRWEIDERGVPVCCQKAIDEHEVDSALLK